MEIRVIQQMANIAEMLNYTNSFHHKPYMQKGRLRNPTVELVEDGSVNGVMARIQQALL